MEFQLTIRHGGKSPRYHMATLPATSLAELLEALPRGIPEDVLGDADLVEIRPAVDPDRREYLE